MLPTRRLLYTLAISGGSRALKPPTTRVRTMSALAATTNTVSNKDGAYVRHAAKHRTDAVEAEAGRYHLHVALACPWAAGALSMLYLKGLEDAISLSVVHPTWQRTRPDDPEDQHCGWVYRAQEATLVPRPPAPAAPAFESFEQLAQLTRIATHLTA